MNVWLSVVAFAIGIGVTASSAEVTLRADDTVVATGELLGFDGRFYRLLGPRGEITLDGQTLTCSGDCPDPDAPELLRISGEAWVVRNVLPALIETFARREDYALTIQPDEAGGEYLLSNDDGRIAVISLTATTSAEGIADIVADLADLAVMIRTPTPAELSLAQEAGRGDLGHHRRRTIIGLDAVVPVVSALSYRKALQEGWSHDLPPSRLHLPDPATGPGQAVLERFPHLGQYEATYHADLDALATAVAEDADSVGLTLFSKVGDAQPIPLVGSCGATLEAARETMKTEDWPYTLPVLLYAPARRLGEVAASFIGYAVSPIAQPVISRTGLVDQFPEVIPFNAQGDRLGLAITALQDDVGFHRLQRTVSELSGHSRLSLTFRFEGGSSQLDSQSHDNVSRLAEAIDQGLFEGRDLLFAGFTDQGGPASINRALSKERAEAVRDAVSAATYGNIELTAEGFGETLPISCDDTEWGRRVNRRVEIWLRNPPLTDTPELGN